MDRFLSTIGTHSLSKTLRFKLIPQGKSEQTLLDYLDKDKAMGEHFLTAKKILDQVYTQVINESLEPVALDWTQLEEAIASKDRQKITAGQKTYRQRIVKAFKAHPLYPLLFKGELINLLLTHRSFDFSDQEYEILNLFSNQTTRFTNFFFTRKNVFSDEDIHSAIAHRIVNVNFSHFVDNQSKLQAIQDRASDILADLNDPDHLLTDYNQLLLQAGIDRYNGLIGGYTTNQKEKIQGLNERINLYNQQHKGQTPLQRLTQLDKQILGESHTLSFVYDPIETDQDLQEELSQLIQTIQDKQFINQSNQLFNDFRAFDLDHLYLSDKQIKKMSQYHYHDYAAIQRLMREAQEAAILATKGKLNKKDQKDTLAYLNLNEEGESKRKNKYYSLAQINQDLQQAHEPLLTQQLTQYWADQLPSLESGLQDLIVMDWSTFTKKESEIERIRTFLENGSTLYQFMRGFIPNEPLELDGNFYSTLNELLTVADEFVTVYNRTRNYLTKKKFSTEKFKVTFDYPQLLSGWSETKVKENRGVIFREGGNYYLGILLNNKLQFQAAQAEEASIDRMVFQLWKDPSRMLPKCIFVTDLKNHFDNGAQQDYSFDPKKSSFAMPFSVTRAEYDLYKAQTFKKEYLNQPDASQETYLQALHQWIDLCKRCLDTYETTRQFNFDSVKNTADYTDLASFYRDVEACCYSLEFEEVSRQQIDRLIDQQELMLFQIYNKDFSERSTGKDNLHTLYFKALFSQRNKEELTFAINANAELFYRRKSIPATPTHQTGEKIVNKTYLKDGIRHFIPGPIVHELNQYVNGHLKELSPEAQAFEADAEVRDVHYPITKDRRYSQNRFFLHLPISINPYAKPFSLRDFQEEALVDEAVNFIGIDRGENNLLYYSVINQEGKIIEQNSLNIINGINYLDKLVHIEKDRDRARKSWTKINAIKEMKEGYLSAAVKKVADLAVQHQALILLENLNVGFKRGRMKIERQVYQKFEKALCSKLEYYIDKQAIDNVDSPALYQGLQLTRPYEERQGSNGIIYYVPASFTSKIDPSTGFVNLFNFNKLKNKDQIGQWLQRFDAIYPTQLDPYGEVFGFDLKLSQFDTYQTSYKDQWTLYSYGERVVYNRQEKTSQLIHLTDAFKAVLDQHGITYQLGDNLIPQLLAHPETWTSVLHLFKQMVNLRNRWGEDDYILSPVLNNQGQFFDSRKVQASDGLPIDADANGAYCIARKGLLLARLNRQLQLDNKKPLSTLSNRDWFEEMQS